eukprot:179630-Pyramimonas_sp.AAC.1
MDMVGRARSGAPICLLCAPLLAIFFFWPAGGRQGWHAHPDRAQTVGRQGSRSGRAEDHADFPYMPAFGESGRPSCEAWTVA